ncbi:MAG TPA: SDR family oxidoreductase [Longimicrobiales bacterium]
MPELRGKAAVVTGGTKGIGRAIVEALLSRGLDVVLGARTPADVERVTAELEAGRFTTGVSPDAAGRVRGVVCDVRDAAACRHLIDAAVSAFGRLDVLVNNAGIGRFGPVEDFAVDDWQAVLETNLSGVFYCSHAAIPHLKRAGGGWIINIGSLAGKYAAAGSAAYNASKFGLVGFSEALMQEVRHDGIRVSLLMPGSVATEFGHPHSAAGDDWRIQPGDIAQMVLDLLDTPARTLPSRIEVRPAMPRR